MFKQKRLTVLSIAVLLALLVAAVLPFAALADDGAPPPPDAPVVEEPSADVPAADEPVADAPAVEEPSADTPVAEEPSVDAPVVDTPVTDAPAADVPPADSPAADAPAVDLTVPEFLEQLPTDTTLVVLDANGESLPLASDAAAQALASPDPYFDVTVGGVTATFRFFANAGDCAAGGYIAYCSDGTATPIQDAIDFLSGNDLTPDDGAIYIDAGNYNENVTIDGSNWTTTPGDLTLVGDGSAMTTINGTFNLSNWANAFWLQGFTITDKVVLDAGGDVTVHDVYVDGSSSYGGLDIYSGGKVDVVDTASIQSSEQGLYVEAVGDVSIWNSSFNDNSKDGAYLISEAGSVDAENSDFSNNGSSGVTASAPGGVTVFDSTFVNNTDEGAYLTSETGSVYIENSDFLYNGGYGVIANPSGDVTIFDSTFDNNAYDGAYISSDAGSIYVENSEFSGNYSNGVTADSFGDLTLNSTLAEVNSVDGAWLHSNAGHVFVENSSFYSNGGYGVIAVAESGDVVIDNVVANDSGSSGMYLFGANIFVSNSEALNNQEHSMEAEYGNFLEICDTTFSGETIVGCDAYFADAEEQAPRSQPETIESTTPEPVEVLASDLPEVTLENLPAPLPPTLSDGSTFTFAGGFSAANIEIPEGGSAEISFSLPEGIDPANLTVLMFNGTEWVELTDFVILPDGTIQLTITFPGEIVFGQKG